MLHYKLNDFLRLELLEGRTKIFIKNKEFKFYCKPLILTIDKDKIDEYDEISSVDEIVNFESKKIKIPPEQEFWGHCSNLQVWIENNYNLNYIHTNLGFPLLRALHDAGDSKAKRVFKDELAKRFCSKNLVVAKYLFLNHFLDYFTKEELKSIIDFYKDISKENNPNNQVILSMCYQQKKNFSKSINILTRILKFELNNQKHNYIKVHVLEGLMRSYFCQKNYDKAEKYVDDLIKFYPNNTTHLFELAGILNHKGDTRRLTDKVIDLYPKIIKLEPRGKSWNILIRTQIELGYFESATISFNKALKQIPNFMQEMLGLCRYLMGVYLEEEDYKKLVKLCKYVLNFSSKDLVTLSYLIYVFNKHGKHHKAIEVGLDALNLIQNNKLNFKGKSYLYHNIAIAYLQVAKYNSAIYLLETASGFDYDNERDNEEIQLDIMTVLASTYRKYAYILFRREKYHESIDLYLKLLKLVQENSYILMSDNVPILFRELGNAYVMIKEYDLAIELFNFALSMEPNNPAIMNDLANVFLIKRNFSLKFSILKTYSSVKLLNIKFKIQEEYKLISSLLETQYSIDPRYFLLKSKLDQITKILKIRDINEKVKGILDKQRKKIPEIEKYLYNIFFPSTRSYSLKDLKLNTYSRQILSVIIMELKIILYLVNIIQELEFEPLELIDSEIIKSKIRRIVELKKFNRK